MKSIIKILFIVFVIIFIYSCSNDTTVNVTPSEPFTLNGTIEPWTLGGNVKLKAEIFDINFFMPPLVLDSTIVSVNGAFTLKMKDVPDSMLYPITFTYDSSCVGNVTVNPPNTKGNYNPNLNYPFGLDLYNDSSSIGFIYKSNYSSTNFIPGQFFVFYMYLNQNVSITGSKICNFGYDTTIYNFSGTRGWNKVVALVNSYTHVTVSATEPAGGKWRAFLMTNDALSNKLSLRQHMFRLNNCIPCK